VAILAVPVFRCPAPLIYDNSVNDLLQRFDPGTLEVGDEITLAGTERFLTMFSFEYWGTNTASPGNLSFAGAVEARIRFYNNDGAPFNGYPTPSSTFYDSGWFGGFSPTPRNTLVFTAGSDFPVNGLYMPVYSNMTWSVEFRGMGLTDTVGVDLYSPPVVGSDTPDYWENDGGVWMLKTNVVPVDFASKMDATTPEPSSIVLAAFGGFAALISSRWMRQRSCR
jgi:hypothetical protein